MDFAVRQFIGSNFSELVDLQGVDLSGRWTKEDFRRHVYKYRGQILAAYHEGRSVGFLCFKRFKRTGLISVWSLVVHAAWRCRGAGLTLLNHLQRWLGVKYTQVSFVLRESNLPAQKMLRKAGFLAQRRIVRNHFVDYYGGEVVREDGYRFVYAPDALAKNNRQAVIAVV